MAPEEPLVYPPHYPPTDKWKKFFIGVRGLGPDLSFFKDLRRQQASRTEGLMSRWQDPTEREIAAELGVLLRDSLRWVTPFFLPEDHWAVVGGGPTYEDIDYLDLEAAITEFEKRHHVRLPDEFWEEHASGTFGQLVSDIAKVLQRV